LEFAQACPIIFLSQNGFEAFANGFGLFNQSAQIP